MNMKLIHLPDLTPVADCDGKPEGLPLRQCTSYKFKGLNADNPRCDIFNASTFALASVNHYLGL
jgi:hypothetical protein